jgi:hypothetical protein
MLKLKRETDIILSVGIVFKLVRQTKFVSVIAFIGGLFNLAAYVKIFFFRWPVQSGCSSDATVLHHRQRQLRRANQSSWPLLPGDESIFLSVQHLNKKSFLKNPPIIEYLFSTPQTLKLCKFPFENC